VAALISALASAASRNNLWVALHRTIRCPSVQALS
jgi:hypothetical protein